MKSDSLLSPDSARANAPIRSRSGVLGIEQNHQFTPQDARASTRCRGRLERLHPNRDSEVLRGSEQIVEEKLVVHAQDATQARIASAADQGQGGGSVIGWP